MLPIASVLAVAGLGQMLVDPAGRHRPVGRRRRSRWRSSSSPTSPTATTASWCRRSCWRCRVRARRRTAQRRARRRAWRLNADHRHARHERPALRREPRHLRGPAADHHAAARRRHRRHQRGDPARGRSSPSARCCWSWLLVKRTVPGRRFEAIGANPRAARAVGPAGPRATSSPPTSGPSCSTAWPASCSPASPRSRAPSRATASCCISVAVVVLGGTSLLGGRGYPLATVWPRSSSSSSCSSSSRSASPRPSRPSSRPSPSRSASRSTPSTGRPLRSRRPGPARRSPPRA